MTKDKKADLRILTTEFRVSHPHVFKAYAFKEGDKPAYSIEMLFDKKTTKLDEFKKRLTTAAIGKWGEDKSQWPELVFPMRDGDKPKRNTKTKVMEIKKEHAGMWVVKASSSGEFSRPHVASQNPEVPLQTEAELYPGCYARAYLTAHAYEFADKTGVKFLLDGVQFLRDGEPFGNKKSATDMFGSVDEAEDAGLTADTDDNSFL